jgi:hypothetical protein
LHDYKKDEADASVYYNLTPRQSSKITTAYLQAGTSLRTAVKIWKYGTGGTNTNDLGYYNLELTIVKLQ